MRSVVVIFIVMQFQLQAQNYLAAFNQTPLVNIGINANPNLNTNMDYTQPINTKSKIPMMIVAQFNIPLFSQKGFDFDARLGTGGSLSVTDNWKVISGISWGIHRTSDITGRYLTSGFKLDCYPGYRWSNWFIGTHFAYDYRPWIHMQYSDYSKNAFKDLYPNGANANAPENGWYTQRFMLLQTGIAVAYIKQNWNINLTTGIQTNFNKVNQFMFPDIGILPIYGGVNVGYGVKR
jgi:hypothetical protein